MTDQPYHQVKSRTPEERAESRQPGQASENATGYIRSRTPEERNAARSKTFHEKLSRQQAAKDKRDAMPIAGDGVTTHGKMISARGGDINSGNVLSNVLIVVDGVGKLYDILILGTGRDLPADA